MRWCFILLLWAIPALAAPEVKVVTSDGQAVTGTLRSLTAEQIEIQASAGPVTLPVANLLGLFPASAVAASAATPPAAWIEFVDRTRLPVTDFLLLKGRVTLRTLDGGELTPVLKTIRTVRFAAAYDPELKIGRDGLSGDQVGVKKKSGVDFIEGIIGDVTAENVGFTLDGDQLPINRAKVDSLVFVQQSDSDLPDAVAMVTGVGDALYAAKSLTYLDDKWLLTTTTGLEFKLASDQVRSADYSSGKLQYLADLKPDTVVVTPLIAVPEKLPLLRAYFEPRFNQGRDDAKLKLDGVSYAKGISLHSRTEITFKLPPKMRRFQALAGIDDAAGDDGHVVVTISGDGKQLFTGEFRGADKPLPLDLDIAGIRKLTILVDYGQDLDLGDYFDLAEARVVK